MLGLCVVGLLWLLWSGRAGRSDQGLTFLLILTGVVSLSYLYDPLEPGEHIWSMRRFVPVVLPGVLVIVALGAGRLVEWVYFEFRTVATTALAAVLVGLMGAASTPVLGEKLWAGVLDQSAAVARTFPEDAAVLVGPGLAGTHVHTSLTYLHGVDTVLVQRNEPGHVLREVVLGWLAAGRPVFIVTGPRGFSLPAPELAAEAIGRASIDLRTLERTRGGRRGTSWTSPSDCGSCGWSGRTPPPPAGWSTWATRPTTSCRPPRLPRGRAGWGRQVVPVERRCGLARRRGRRPGRARGRRVAPARGPPAEISVWAGPHRIAEGGRRQRSADDRAGPAGVRNAPERPS